MNQTASADLVGLKSDSVNFAHSSERQFARLLFSNPHRKNVSPGFNPVCKKRLASGQFLSCARAHHQRLLECQLSNFVPT